MKSTALILMLIGVLLYMGSIVTSCVYNSDIPKEGVKWSKGTITGKPAKDKPIFVTRGDYQTDEDFRKALCKKVAWLEGKGYEIKLIKPVYGKDLAQKEVIKYYIIYYKEVKK